MRCSRCGNEDLAYFYLDGTTWYCRKCIAFGRVDVGKGVEAKAYRKRKIDCSYSLKYPLTPLQKQAVSKIMSFLKQKKDVLVYAACGAGKTELTMDAIRCASDLAKEKEIAVASHDDDTIEKLDVVQSFGATISEFPITLEVAKEAKKRGMYTVVGAPNILLGGSHSGNMSARDAIEAGCADILCSDYYPASLLHSVFKMEEYGQKLEDMIAKVTIQPARAAQIDHICGSIEKNKKADLLIIMKLPNGLPAITHVFVDGQLTQRNHYRM